MLHDSITLVNQSKIKRSLIEEGKAGNAFPLNPNEGDDFQLTEDITDYVAGIYVYSSERVDWVLQTNISVTPYDLGLTIFDRPKSEAIVCKVYATRSFVIDKNFENSLARANVAATAQYVLNVFRLAEDNVTETKLGELSFEAGSSIGTFSVETPDVPMTILRGETLFIKAPLDRDATLKDIDVAINANLAVTVKQ